MSERPDELADQRPVEALREPSAAHDPPDGANRASDERGAGEALQSIAAGDGAELDPSKEEEVWSGRADVRHFAARIALWWIGIVVFGGLTVWGSSRWEWLTGWGAFWAILIAGVVSGAVVLGGVVLKIFGTRYRLTNQRLFIERGIIRQTIDQSELIRVDDVRMYKSFVDRIFGLGSVAVMSTDISDAEVRIEGVSEPEKIAESIRLRMRTMRRKSLFVENL